ncbi:MAG: hypothetical protein J6M62_05085 [Selenomonadaceae bacterium]|nr:hypothetical protein [Selenomonadaceae bacterium]MBP3722651.1 hypothetical protein [Selenomonadaceae bacterium]
MKKYLILISLILTLASGVSFAEERFVGEYGDAGYYAEVDNITLSGDYLVTNVTVKKPFYNKFILETVRFNMKENTYELLKQEIYQYNPREFVESRKVFGAPLPLTDGSPYKAVMEFVLSWQKMTEYDI